MGYWVNLVCSFLGGGEFFLGVGEFSKVGFSGVMVGVFGWVIGFEVVGGGGVGGGGGGYCFII